VSLAPGGQQTLTAVVQPRKATDAVVWSTSRAGKVEVIGNDRSAVITGKQAGSAKITATISGKSASASVAVSAPVPAGPVGRALVAISGGIPGMSGLSSTSVKAQIELNQQLTAKLPYGAGMVNTDLPAYLMEGSGDTYRVRLDPALVPPRAMSEGGIVDFDVYVQDPKRAVWVTTSASVRAVVLSDGSYGWTDPLAATLGLNDPGAASKIPAAARKTLSGQSRIPKVTGYAPKTEPVVTDEATPEADGVYCDSYGCATTEGATPEERAAATPPGAQPPAAPARLTAPLVLPRSTSSNPCQGKVGVMVMNKRVPVRLEKQDVWATIGTAYPIGGDQAWMDWGTTESSSVSVAASLGMAYKDAASAGFTARGSKSLTNENGFTWSYKKKVDDATKARSFLVKVRYQRVQTWLCSWAYGYNEPTAHLLSEQWVPLYYTGGTNHGVGLTRPDWNGEDNCQEVDTGVLRRSRSDGSAYSYSAGVHAKEIVSIGIDMSVRRQYNTNSVLYYHVKKPGRFLCGNDGPPFLAGKVMERMAVSNVS
jgi:hypothetical protein